MARVFEKRGEWWIDFRDADGQRHREPAGEGAGHALAKQFLAKRLTEVAERRHFPERQANAKSFDEVAARFWDLHGKTLRSDSWGGMLSEVRQRFKGHKIGNLTAADIQRHYNEVAARASASTANRHLTLWRLVFNKAISWGDHFGVNPCSKVKKQREAPSRLRFLSTDEIRALYDVASPRIYPLLACAILTGMRKGEILGLRWENVSLERSILYLLRTKSGRSREIPIGSKLQEVLELLGPKSEGFVFDLPVITLRRDFEKALKAAKIPASGPDKVTLHSLRHTFASHFIMRTNDLPALQRLLGHSTPGLTLRYAHLSQGHQAANIATFEAAMPAKAWRPIPQAQGSEASQRPAIA